MYQKEEPLQFPWYCATCKEQNDFFLRKCQYCGTNKEQFCEQMRIDYNTNLNEYFKQLIIIDFDCNKVEDRQEILELLICKMQIMEYDHKVIWSKQFIIKPFLIPLIQNPDYCSITQEQADKGVKFEETFQNLDGEFFLFESSGKAKIFQDQCQYLNLECPIKKYIELRRVFPNSNGTMTINCMLKTLKIPYDSDCFALAEIVAELFNRAYRFQKEMIQTLAFPIPEEENRLVGFDNIIVLDFEATCVQENNKKFNQEIIEFPAQVYNLQERKVTKVYSKYVKPTENPILTNFCTELTGITQDQVDNGILLEQAVQEFQDFIKDLGKSCILTCGDYDLHLLKKEAQRKSIEINKSLKYYINIKKVFPKHLRDQNYQKDPCMVQMLELCHLDLQGRHHSGIDDVKNITRIVDFLISNENFKFDERMILYTFKI